MEETTNEAHTHDGSVEVYVPHWIPWAVIGFGFGAAISWAINAYYQRQETIQALDAAHQVATMTKAFLKENESPVL